MAIKDQNQYGANRNVVSVSDLNRSARRLLEGEFPMVYVEGEISNFARPSSGHWYFTLKDDSAQLRSAMFRGRNSRLRFVPRNGLQVMVRGKISLYEGRGEYQLIAEHMEEAGDGALQRAFEKLKANLQLEGLFDESKKKNIPSMPEHVGIITSPTGAAIHDVLTVMRRRFPAVKISIIPVQVQGDASILQITNAIELANQFTADPFDIILLTRGGGSLEDLWSFNTEPVARAIANSKLPIVCAVGHESDVSIADFVADLRAPTPSAAAELITPDVRQWQSMLTRVGGALRDRMSASLNDNQNHLVHISKRLRHPRQRVQDLYQRLDDMEIRLKNSFRYQMADNNLDETSARLFSAMERKLEQEKNRIALAARGLINPVEQINAAQKQTSVLSTNLKRTISHTIERKASEFQALIHKLNALSPLNTLERGYAIVTTEEGQVVTRADEVKAGDMIKTRLAQGELRAQVKSISTESK